MVVYVESNFVLELALFQEQQQGCEKIVSYAEAGGVRLVIPAYSLVEPYETTTRTFKRRQAVGNSLQNELGQLHRSMPYRQEADALNDVTALFVRMEEEERVRLRDVLHRLLDAATVVPLTPDIIARSFDHQAHGFPRRTLWFMLLS